MQDKIVFMLHKIVVVGDYNFEKYKN